MDYVKICGLKQLDHVQLCIDYGADAVGFIYNVPASPRNLQAFEIKHLLSEIADKILTVIVFKPNTILEVIEVMNEIPASFYQIHPGFNIKELKRLSNYRKSKIILALKIDQTNKQLIIEQINYFKEQFFAFLIDNSEGHGNKFDLVLVKDILKGTEGARIIVAGGINAENVENIIDFVKPYGIDVSSSLESEKGVKNPFKIKEFLEKV